MDVSQAGIDLIKRFEQFRSKSYQDQGGVWTVGWGCTGPDIGPDTIWDLRTADAALQVRAELAAHCVDTHVTRKISQNQFDALTSFTYNVGAGNFEESTLLRKVNDGDPGAVQEFARWDKVKGIVSEGLSNRRYAEMQLFSS